MKVYDRGEAQKKSRIKMKSKIRKRIKNKSKRRIRTECAATGLWS